MKKFFITQGKVEKGKRHIRVYKTKNGEPIFIGYKEFRIDQTFAIEQAIMLLAEKKRFPKSIGFVNFMKF